MSRESSKLLLRAGQCRWLPIVYKPGVFADYPDSFVAMVKPCHITSVKGTTVKYLCGYGDDCNPYIAGHGWLKEKTYTTRNQAKRAVLAMLAAQSASAGEKP